MGSGRVISKREYYGGFKVDSNVITPETRCYRNSTEVVTTPTYKGAFNEGWYAHLFGKYSFGGVTLNSNECGVLTLAGGEWLLSPLDSFSSSSGSTPAATKMSLSFKRTWCNVNLANELASRTGYDQSFPVELTVTIEEGSVLFGETTSSPACSTGNLPAGSSVILVNKGSIIGAGGEGGKLASSDGKNGGPCLKLTVPTAIKNTGLLAGGGGGGGASVYDDDFIGGGGGGAGFLPGVGGYGNSSTGSPGVGITPGSGGEADPLEKNWGGNGGRLGSQGEPAWVYTASRSEEGLGGAPGHVVLGSEHVTWLEKGRVSGIMTPSDGSDLTYIHTDTVEDCGHINPKECCDRLDLYPNTISIEIGEGATVGALRRTKYDTHGAPTLLEVDGAIHIPSGTVGTLSIINRGFILGKGGAGGSGAVGSAVGQDGEDGGTALKVEKAVSVTNYGLIAGGGGGGGGAGSNEDGTGGGGGGGAGSAAGKGGTGLGVGLSLKTTVGSFRRAPIFQVTVNPYLYIRIKRGTRPFPTPTPVRLFSTGILPSGLNQQEIYWAINSIDTYNVPGTSPDEKYPVFELYRTEALALVADWATAIQMQPQDYGTGSHFYHIVDKSGNQLETGNGFDGDSSDGGLGGLSFTGAYGYDVKEIGGDGGDLGQAGSNGTSGYGSAGVGGLGGSSVEGNSNITWVLTGTRIGAII